MCERRREEHEKKEEQQVGGEGRGACREADEAAPIMRVPCFALASLVNRTAGILHAAYCSSLAASGKFNHAVQLFPGRRAASPTTMETTFQPSGPAPLEHRQGRCWSIRVHTTTSPGVMQKVFSPPFVPSIAPPSL